MKRLLSEYNVKKGRIKQRLKKFKDIHKKKDSEIFKELCFCLLTPQSKAVLCDGAVKELERSGLLFNGKRRAIRDRLRGVRFPNNKTDYMLAARKLFSVSCARGRKSLDIKKRLNIHDIFRTRDWLVRNVKGLGYKEASHFLRNIGLGKDLAILDVHILRNLERYGVVKDIPASLSRKDYLAIEEKMRRFSKKIKIPLEELDLLFWSKEAGLIFK